MSVWQLRSSAKDRVFPLIRNHFLVHRFFLAALAFAFVGYIMGAFTYQLLALSTTHVLLYALAFLGLLSVATAAMLALVGPEGLVEQNGPSHIAICAPGPSAKAASDPAGEPSPIKTSSSADASSLAAASGLAAGPNPLPASNERNDAGVKASATAEAKRSESLNAALDEEDALTACDTRRVARHFARLLDAELDRYGLTPQELAVAERIARNDTYAAIAQRMYLTESTIKFHARNIFAKAGVSSKREFLLMVERNVDEAAPHAGQPRKIPQA